MSDNLSQAKGPQKGSLKVRSGTNSGHLWTYRDELADANLKLLSDPSQFFLSSFSSPIFLSLLAPMKGPPKTDQTVSSLIPMARVTATTGSLSPMARVRPTTAGSLQQMAGVTVAVTGSLHLMAGVTV